MFASPSAQARFLVITGFALSAMAAVISYFHGIFSYGYSFNSFRGFVSPLLSPLLMIAAAFAWSWLSRVIAANERQLALLKKGFYALAIQYFLYCALYLSILLPARKFGDFWTTTQLWLVAIGAIVASTGFIVLSRSLELRKDAIESITTS
jgi:glucose uptake protein GlcU